MLNLSKDFRGVALVVRDGETLYESATGYADLANRIPNTMDTRFASASAGKVFVAVGILQLASQGRLSLDDPLGKHILRNLHQIDPEVTIRQLLNHTSGVPDYFDESVMDDYEALWVDLPNYRIRRNADLYPLFIHKPMMYPRGTKFQYNNTGYVLLATILEVFSGMTFDAYLHENVFLPCGMLSTGYFELDRLPARCANSYIRCEDGGWRTNIYSVDAKGTGAGGAFITAGDAVRFWQGLLRGKLLPIEWVYQMMQRQSGGPDEYYGYGLWISPRTHGPDVVYFQGYDPGVSFLSQYDPGDGTITTLLSNYADPAGEAGGARGQ